jgi:predicted nucleotidyltransferase
MLSHPPSEQLLEYKRGARARWLAEQQQIAMRRARAQQLARATADLLKAQFGVTRVVLFGSLIHAGRFHLHSDADVAAWGLTATNWLRAMSAVAALASDIEINLVDIETCSPELLSVIEREGVQL